MKTRFFTFSQNNSGGSFDTDKERGITHFVIIEATDADDANRRAERIGLYFDGEGDCPCCGNRWYDAGFDEAGDKVPTIYSKPAVYESPTTERRTLLSSMLLATMKTFTQISRILESRAWKATSAGASTTGMVEARFQRGGDTLRVYRPAPWSRVYVALAPRNTQSLPKP